MDKKKKKLLIYIPSYNRANSLLLQLEKLFHIPNNTFDVYVNDNNSIEDYSNVKKVCEDNAFYYNRNKINVGGDANIFNGFLLSFDYEYLWILSDDDLITDNAVEKILEILDMHKIDLLFLTHSKIKNIEFAQWSQKDFYEHNIRVSDGAGLISNVIYKVDYIKDSIPEGFQNIYTCFAHLAVLIHSFQNKKTSIGKIGSYHFFIPETNLPPSISSAYSKSYFGFVLLAELFDGTLKKEFLGEWASFWNLRHWHIKKKDAIAKQNCIYAKNYILTYGSIFDFFRLKLCIWYVLTPIFSYAKKYKHKVRN